MFFLFVFLMETHVTRNFVNLHKSFWWGKCWEVIAIFNMLKIRMRLDIFVTENCKFTFCLKYIYQHSLNTY